MSNLLLEVRIGVTDQEQAIPQRLAVSLMLHPCEPFEGLNDDIARTIDYAEVCAAVRTLAAAPPRRLIETLAGDIAAAVLEDFPACAAVEVELRKFILPDTDHVAVRLARRRSGV